MSLARIKTWIAGDLLKALDINNEFNNILNNPISLISPTTAAITFSTAQTYPTNQLSGMSSGALLVGTSSAASTLAIGTVGQILVVASGPTPGWKTATPTVQVLSTTATYTPTTTAVTAALVMCIGGGGAGGGSNSTASNGGGGGSGEVSWRMVTAAQIAGSQSVTIPAASTAITAGANAAGGAGGSVSFGALVIATGGAGGAAGPSGGAGGIGGFTGTYTWHVPGCCGQAGCNVDATGNRMNSAGGGPGGGAFTGAGVTNSGGGGGGGSATVASGGGGAGQCTVIEFYT